MLTKKDHPKNDVKSSTTAKNTSPSQETEQPNTCCQPATKAAPSSAQSHQTVHHTDKKGGAKTRVTVKYDVGFSNQLSIRGKGANLNWEKGQPLKNVKPDEWIWETDVPFTQCEFKVLINDRVYENGDNHQLNTGSTIVYTPRFS